MLANSRVSIYDVLMVENRQTLSSGCRVPSEPAWSWVATLQDRTQIRQESPPEPESNSEPATSDTGAIRPNSRAPQR